MKIYTKTGDKGTTSLVGGERVAKNDIRLESYGTVDELNSFLGMLRAKLDEQELKEQILNIQNQLFAVGAQLAFDSDNGKEIPEYAQIKLEWVTNLESEIDLMNERLPKMTRFIVYGEDELSALCHVCRAICRRAERAVVTVCEHHNMESLLVVYLNRLSDYLFVLARALSPSEKKSDFFRK